MRRVVVGALCIAFAWAYWPTFQLLWTVWSGQADYSHGFLVIPLALAFLWLRRDMQPAEHHPAPTVGLLLLAFSLYVRYVGLRYSFFSLDGYSLVIWVAAVVLLLGGYAYFKWALPSILFLLFMVPMPFQIERMLSVPLQHVATSMSSFLLQCLGQPAFAEGTTIILGSHELYVEQECSGLRMFVGAFALAFAYLIATRRELWEQVLLLASVVPVALLANSIRIVITGLLYRYLDNDELVRKMSHDLAGLFMIPFAAMLFAAVLIYLACLAPKIKTVGIDEFIERSRV